MNRCLLVAGTFLFAPLPSQAARISEPDTILYGRITDRLVDREFLVTSGQLTWNFRTTGPGGRNFNLTTTLESLGGGRYSYRLAIPHQLLAYDLSVNPKSVALSSVGGRLEHLGVSLNGKPLAVNPAAVDGLALDTTRRASAVRVDLSFSSGSTDSDGDGAPDWWEDQQGLDKFDPADAAKPATDGIGSNGTTGTPSSRIGNFADWRAAWFPGNTQDLDLFGQLDPDADGISNLLEYAFDLNPTAPETQAPRSLPHAFSSSGRGGVGFQRRVDVADLSYQVEVSSDLLNWADGTNVVVESAGESSQSVLYLEKPELAESTHRFFRIRVTRR
ncbi:MAG: hypothetical protein IT581_02055 [Verrucomicrobiales bacterium]|nr:hypothetical protein [Verrucomicrobiales bacterium]